jgi:16S rRNA (guanine527-N7)-methyltransferase
VSPGRSGPREGSSFRDRQSRAPDRSSRLRKLRRPAAGPKAPAKPFARKIGRGNPDSMVARQPWGELEPLLQGAGIEPGPAIERLRAYMDLLLKWNREVSNLISTNDEHRFVSRHLRESIEPVSWLKEASGARWIDFGSGGGLPALPLALCGIGASWTLVESRRTKTLFLRKAIQELDIKNIEVINDRLENLIVLPENAGVFDAFSSRATLTLGPTLKFAAAIVKPGGQAFLWKGSRHESEMEEERFWRSVWEPEGILSIGTEQTVVCRFRKKSAV